MTLNKITNIFLIIFVGILAVGGMLSLHKGFSPEWRGHEGGAAVGGAFQALSFQCHGLLLWMVAGWAIAMYKMSTTQNKKISIFWAAISAISGLFLSYSDLINQNPFTISNDEVLHLIPDRFFGLLSGAMLVLIAINAIAIVIFARTDEDR